MLKTLTAAALLLAAGTAHAQNSGPYIDAGGPRNFTPVEDGTGIYVQDDRLRWYHATFTKRCESLATAFNIGWKTYDGRLERGSTVLAGHEPCRIATIARSDAPPEFLEAEAKRKAS